MKTNFNEQYFEDVSGGISRKYIHGRLQKAFSQMMNNWKKTKHINGKSPYFICDECESIATLRCPSCQLQICDKCDAHLHQGRSTRLHERTEIRHEEDAETPGVLLGSIATHRPRTALGPHNSSSSSNTLHHSTYNSPPMSRSQSLTTDVTPNISRLRPEDKDAIAFLKKLYCRAALCSCQCGENCTCNFTNTSHNVERILNFTGIEIAE